MMWELTHGMRDTTEVSVKKMSVVHSIGNILCEVHNVSLPGPNSIVKTDKLQIVCHATGGRQSRSSFLVMLSMRS